MLGKALMGTVVLVLAGCASTGQPPLAEATLAGFTPLEREAYDHCLQLRDTSQPYVVQTCHVSADGQHMVIEHRLLGGMEWTKEAQDSERARMDKNICGCTVWEEWLSTGHTLQFKWQGRNGYATRVYDKPFCQPGAEQAAA